MVVISNNYQIISPVFRSNSVAYAQNSKPEEPQYKDNSKLLLTTLACLAVGIGAVVMGRKGHLGDGVQKFLKGSSKAQKPVNIAANNINSSHSQKAISKLVEFYEGIANAAKANGNTKRHQIYSDFAQKAQKGEFSGKDLYDKLFKEYYNKLRRADYPADSKFNSKISEFTEKSTSKIQVRDENNWHYRIPINRKQLGWSTADKCMDRISVNAVTDEKLITSLDDLFASGKVKGYYKTPNDSAAWLERHDPITIYLHESASPKILAEVEKITKPYIRSTDDVLTGNKFAPGLALEKSPQPQEIKDLIDKAAKIDADLAKALENEFSSKGNLKASAGQMTAAERLLSLFN